MASRTGVLGLVLASALAGCQGYVIEPGAEPGVSGGRGGPGGPGSCEDPKIVARSRLPRLSNHQLASTLRDLLFLDPTAELAGFSLEAGGSGFDRGDALHVSVENGYAEQLQSAAEALAARAVAESFDDLVPCDPAASGCAGELVRAFGRRAFRRPLTDEEASTFDALFASGADLYPSMEPFEAGARLVIEAMLQMPDFVYRVEQGEAQTVEGYELASRLSYALWSSMPDDALLDAAEDGALDDAEVLGAEVERMLDDARARGMFYDFHEQWLGAERFDSVGRDAARYPEYAGVGPDDLRAELRAYVDAAVLDAPTSFRELLAGRTTYVNRDLAAVYGAEGVGPEGLVELDLTGTGRAGLLTQVGFLSSRATDAHPNLANRGAFVYRQVLCRELADPPADLDLDLPAPDATIRTERDRFEHGTANQPCAGCHNQINPFGFAFEHFDAAGRWREMDNDAPIDASGEITLDGQRVQFDGAEALIDAIADSQEARSCYARQWVRYLYERADQAEDQCLVDTAAERLGEPGYTVRDLVRDLVLSSPLRLRSTEEE